MPETFDVVVANPGAGGARLAGDSLTQPGGVVFLPASYLVVGGADGPYERVSAANPLPVGLRDADGNALASSAVDPAVTWTLPATTRGLVTRSAIYLWDTLAEGGWVPLTNEVGLPVTISNPLVQVAGQLQTYPSPLTGGGTVTSVAASLTAVTLLNQNIIRYHAAVYNESTAILYLKLGTAPSSTSYTVAVAPGGFYEAPPNYAGPITAVWSAAAGNARVTELIRA